MKKKNWYQVTAPPWSCKKCGCKERAPGGQCLDCRHAYDVAYQSRPEVLTRRRRAKAKKLAGL